MFYKTYTKYRYWYVINFSSVLELKIYIFFNNLTKVNYSKAFVEKLYTFFS